MGGQQALQLIDGLRSNPLERQVHPYRLRLVEFGRPEYLDVLADDLGEVLPTVDPSLHEHDHVVGQLVAVVGHGLGEDHHLHGAAQVLEEEYGHQIAATGPLLVQVGDHAADGPEHPVLGILQLGDGGIRAATQGRFVAPKRMVRHVEAQHLLLEGQAGHLVELDIGDSGPFVE